MTKVMTVVGTRPEIIRLSEVIKRLDTTVDHVLVHTGQNYDYELNEIFFEDLGLRKPDYFLGVDTSSLGHVLGEVLIKTEEVLSWPNACGFPSTTWRQATVASTRTFRKRPTVD